MDGTTTDADTAAADNAAAEAAAAAAAELPPDKQVRMEFIDARTGRKRSNAHTVAALRAKFSKSLENIAPIPVLSTNPFNLLAGADDVPPMPPLTPKPTLQREVHRPDQAAHHETQQSKTKRERVPSITIKWNASQVQSEMTLSNMKRNSYLLEQVRGGTVVKISTIADYEAFLKRCIERQIPHFTHQVASQKPTRIVLLGLPNIPVEEIYEALAHQNVVPDDIKPMKIRKESEKYLEHNNFILYFKKGTTTTAKLREIKAINNVIVRWAYYDAKRHGPTQCRRCQEWGHGSSHCHLAPACVKCAGDHETSACTLAGKGVKVPEDKLKCANCKQAHSANYGGCTTRKEFIASRPQKKQPQPNRRQGGQQKRYTPHFQVIQQWPGLSSQQHHQPVQQRPQPGPPPRQQWSSQGSPPFQHPTTSKKNVHPTNNTNNSSNKPNVDTPFTADEVFEILDEVNAITSSGKSRPEQFRMIIQLARKYNTSFNG